MGKFSRHWEPTLLREDVLASGTWWYQDEIPYEVALVRQQYDYTSMDLVELGEVLHPEGLDYIDYAISDEGRLYFWKFARGDENTVSSTFGTYFTAREHIDSYGYRYELDRKDI